MKRFAALKQVTLKNANDILPECRGICVCQVKGHGRLLVLRSVQCKPSVCEIDYVACAFCQGSDSCHLEVGKEAAAEAVGILRDKVKGDTIQISLFQAWCCKTNGLCTLPSCFWFP